MDYVGKIGTLISSLNNFYNEINPATLSGAIDIIVVEKQDKELTSTPFHVRFGKLSVLLPQEKKVEIQVNGEKVPYLMKVGEAGEAFFVFETSHYVPEEFQTSPILQAIAESKTNGQEDPPFLDISETNKFQEKLDEKAANDTFEDEEYQTVPAQLQSPKMIIEEQMDKVVNTVYKMNDGSSLLERKLPSEAITTTTIAKEQFIVRPVDGDVHTTRMDITHTVVDKQMLDNTDTQSIVLDMSGYKTRRDSDSDSDEEEVDEKQMEEESKEEETVDDHIKSLGWMKSINEDDQVTLIPNQVYRIEMSLCGLINFGYDPQENDTLFKQSQITYDDFVRNPSILNDSRLVFKYNDHYFSAIKNNPLFTSLLVFREPLKKEEQEQDYSRETYTYGKGWRQWLSRSSSAQKARMLEDEDEEAITTFTTTTKTTSIGWEPDQENDIPQEEPVAKKMYAKTLRLTSDQLKQLNLKKGVNTITFTVSSAYQGKASCVAKVFFWDYDIQVVISDIDGTITKSDAMGHLMTMIGKDWTHQGVAKLYTDISNNGYHFMYLTSRAIGQADYTRDYLKKVLQGNYQLPDGPVIMSPDRLFTSFHREVILRKPEVFKMACLKDVQRLFGGRDPFFAGFGNRITDAISYRSVNMPSTRIFTIDTASDVKLDFLIGFKSTYIHLNDLVDQIFPPIHDKTITEEYTDYNYWKQPIMEIDIPELEEVVVSTPTSPKPKPIKPDLNSLPKESIVDTMPTRRRGLLRGFRSSSTSIAQPKPPPILIASMSEPTLQLQNLNVPGLGKRSQTGIMQKVIGGVFSRSKLSPPPWDGTNIASSPPSSSHNTKDNDTSDDDNSEKEEDPDAIRKEEEDQDLLQQMDDLDLDEIPFI